MRTRFTADYVLAHVGGHHTMLRQGQVVYEDDRIIYVGQSYDGPLDESYEMGASLITPGLIDLDALADIDHLILDSWVSDERSAGLQWSEEYFETGRRDVFTAEERQLIREYALVQLALHGITTYMPIGAETHSAWAEGYDEMVGMGETSRRIGLRGYLGPAYRSGVNIVRSNGERDVEFNEDLGRAGLSDAIRFLDYADELADPLINGVLLPCRLETLSEEILVSTATAMRERNVLVRLHCMQSLLERKLLNRWYGQTPLQLLERTGLLAKGLLIPHAALVDRSPEVYGVDHGDLDTMARAGISVIHCPMTSLRYGSVLHSFGTYLDAGINMCLGTDSFPPDLIRGMDIGVHLGKLVDGALDSAPAERYFDAATIGGALALQRSDLGKLEAGAQADLVVFSLGDIRDGVLDDPVRTLLLSGTARQVTYSVVAGRIIVRDRTIPGTDLTKLQERAQGLFHKMREAYSERDLHRRAPEALFPPSYPPADPYHLSISEMTP